MREVCSLLLLTLCLLLGSANSQEPNGQQHGFISFVESRLVIEEDTGQSGFTSVTIPLVREGGTSGIVFAAITIQNADASDFLTTSVVATFLEGETNAVANVFVINDNIPEGNETFTVVISDALSGAEVGLRSSMELVISANDEPFGSVQFDASSLVMFVSEPPTGTSNVQLNVTRGPGTFGQISVDYQVTSDLLGVDDLSPFQGQLVFNDQVSSRTITLMINADSLPEPDETFSVQLTTPRGGATLANEGTIAMVTIRENDSPVSWNRSVVEVSEDVGTVELEISRGVLVDGSTAGDLSQTTTISVTTVSGTASAGVDFDPVSTTITFPPGSTSQSLTIRIHDDQTVEGDETFTVVLSSPSPDAVLVPPSQVTVIIAVNDNAGGIVSFASPGPVIISEDGGDVGMFIVQRSVGTFGSLTIEWMITDNIDQSVASADFQPPSGTVVIEDGANEGVLQVVALNDNLPEVAEGFTVQLVRIVNGDGVLSETGVRVASLIVAESDDVYGLVEWGQQNLFTVTNTILRELQLVVIRSLGNIGTVSVDYAIVYLPVGSTDGDPSVITMATGSVQLQGGQVQREFSVTIADSAFLDTGGMFRATLTNTSLIGGATLLIPSMVSPRIGPRAEVMVEVPSNAANGYIGFDPVSSVQVSVEEPPTTATPVRLTVTRTGSYGLAEVMWAATPLSTDITDIGGTSGVISIPDSANTTTLEVLILPDNVPEIDELFVVTLVTTSQANQRIRPEQSVATVTILQNDAAEGVFSISQSTLGPFVLDESDNGIISILIVREGGALTSEVISYSIPGGGSEILGGQSLAAFGPQQREFPVTLLINNDNIPETNETYQFEISILSGNSDLLGMPSGVEITILANDDYAGLFSFDSASLDQSIIEPKDFAVSTATFRVQRSRGTFTDVSVEWEVVSGGVADIQPIRGVVNFIEGQSSATFEISALPDNLSEASETFVIRLTSVSGDGQLDTSSTEAQLTVLQNDDPINFQRSFLSTTEGDTVMFTLERGGQAGDVADVSFIVDYQTATLDDVIITPQGGMVTFLPGQTQAMITVSVVSDGIPEESELLVIRLTSTTGDAVIVSPNVTTLLIAPSDDPNGLFQFEMDMVEATEGETISLSVERLAGIFGQVSLSWTVYQLNTTTGARSSEDVMDITPTTNFITFDPGNMTADVQFTIIDDVIPELEERFEIELTILNIVGDSNDGARIGDISIATVIVAPSDDPYGLLLFPTRILEIAEDIPANNPSLGELSVPVERGFGIVGEIRVAWEIVTTALPPYSDLLLNGEVRSGVTSTASRPDTDTSALLFPGQPGAIVTVPLQSQPIDVSLQISISLWLQPTPGTSGILVAQATDSSPIYRLSLIADSVNYIIRFSYITATTNTLVSVETSVLQSSLSEGAWHSLVISATSSTASFYVDGSFLTSRILDSPVYGGRGQLTVGGVSDSVSSSDFYSGGLQDVRVFSAALSQSEVLALAVDTPALSLTPISGYLTYPPGITMATITITSKDDSTPEPSQEFVIQLANAVGGARIDTTQNSASLTVLKSDSSNGVFGFDPSSVAINTTEGMGLSLLVTRSEGLFSSVTVYWDIRQEVGGVTELANMDFAPASGQIIFLEGQREERINTTVVNEVVPELSEQFVTTLTSAVAGDNQTNSTPLSGASINPALSQAMVTVSENDHPYGLFQFVSITPATTMPEIFVEESVGLVTVFVVRAQGVLGDASVEYVTSEGSARSGGGLPDFVPTAGTLRFSGDSIVQSFNVSVLDNEIPELRKTFYVNLTNPLGDLGTPSLGIGSTLAVHIQPSDDAFGRFDFRTDSQARVVAEQQGGTPVTLTVVREGGVFGVVSLYWSVSQSQGSEVTDITPTEGTLVFNEGEPEAVIQLLVRDDLVAELDEVFIVQLINVSVGASLGTLAIATITVEASDHPYGLFVFSPSFRPLTGVREGQEVIVTVTREFGILGEVTVGVVSVVSTDPRLNSLDINLEVLQDDSQLASPGLDYTAVNSTLNFPPGQTTASLSVRLLDDSLPELSEYFFLVLTHATLNFTSVETVDTSVLPTVAMGNESIATVVIEENDNARGVIEFSQASVTTTEPSQDILTLLRREGTFGEILVQWEVAPISSSTSDYSPVAGVVTFAPGVSMMPLPLTIVDDTVPEFAEDLVVRLVGVTTPAQLGDVITVIVTIEANDDPNGALEFTMASMNIEVSEPTASPAVASFIVQRVGGAVGVVEVLWNVTNVDGSSASSDILPVEGTLQFVTNVRQQTIQLSVLPDQIPEITEMFRVSLETATGGARIIEGNSLATLTIPENDGPFGVVSFGNPASVAMEIGQTGTSVTMIPVLRSLGTFGDIEVIYSIRSADAADLALSTGTPLLNYFTAASPNEALDTQFLLQALDGTLEVCARACLSNQACRSFSINSLAGQCQLYFSNSSGGASTIVAMGTDYYKKFEELTLPFYQAVASEGNDFSSAIGQTIVISDGVAMATIPVTIIGDSIPELNESLIIELVGVGLIESSIEGTSSSGEPMIGAISITTLVILENDDPRGRFTIYGSNGLSVTRVSEPEGVSFGVSLTVERLGGTLGEVTVEWSVVNSTAQEGSDYAGSGALLTFSDGEVRSTVAITILADDIPERDETIYVVLSNPVGGATIGPGDEGNTLIIIEANGAAAGVVGFAPLSRSAVVGEDESVGLLVQRSVSALGMVAVDWELSTMDGRDPANDFVSTFGTAVFNEGENMTEIVISVLADSTPEVAERYTLTLIETRTLSDNISPPGHATLDPQAAMATVTIRASNNPHGVVEFQPPLLPVRIGESQLIGQITVIRQFGSFGVVDVNYVVEGGNISALASNESLATPGIDFVSEGGVVRLEDGQQSAVIPVSPLDDVDPELDEVFLVRLTSVTLVGEANNTILPSIGADNVREVVIVANDSPQGEMTFQQESYEVSEGVGVFQLPILREQGLVGQVSVVYFVTNGRAVNGEDFSVVQLEELVFAPGQAERTVAIGITNDVLPEVDEEFCVQLQLPRSGAVLGNITTTCVTISANDDAYGVFSFDSTSLSATVQETEVTTTASNVAELRVVRAGGLFGQITVPFEVRSVDGVLSTADLSPLTGSALVFNAEDSFRILQLEAVRDSIPELDETFIITLLPPTELGRLATTNITATVVVESNQDPYGVFDLSVVGGVTAVEEGVGRIDFRVTRSFGTFGEVSVTLETVDGTAVFSAGSALSYAAIQALTLVGAEQWYSFTMEGGQTMLILGGEIEAQLLAWRGVFTPVQTLPVNRAAAFNYFSPQQGVDLLVVANAGRPGNRELTVDVYQFSGTNSLTLLQTIPSVGATDVISFSVSGQWYVLVANGEDNQGNTIVDSTLWAWNGTLLEPFQTLPTIGASALDMVKISGSLYVGVASLTDTRSQVYIWRESQLRLNHTFDSQSVTDILFLSVTPPTLAVAMQSGVTLLLWSPDAQQFIPNTTLTTDSTIRLERSTDSQQLFITNSLNNGQLLQYSPADGYVENTDVILPVSRHLYPFTLDSTPYLGAASVGGGSQSVVMETVQADRANSDYISRRVNLTYAPGESTLSFSTVIVDDVIPEIDESFVVRISDPVGGARIGQLDAVTIVILTNDDAHGLIGFDENSLSVVRSEMDSVSPLVLNVVRVGGAFGRVSVSWEVMGDHENGEVTPTQGQVIFPDGETMATITLLIQSDIIPELNELTTVTLTAVLENGVPEGGDVSRGAKITPSQSQAVVTVEANDAPHGVITWTPSVVMVTEDEGIDNNVQLSLVREFGAIGAVVITYTTSVASLLPLEQQAAELLDFIPTSGQVIMGNEETTASVTITVLHDNLAELTESFFLNITDVRLVDEADRQGSASNSPRAGVEAIEVQIIENDNSRGRLSFSLTAVTGEEVVGGRAVLEVRREGGTFGTVGAEFIAVGVSASSTDFAPLSGTVTFEPGVSVAFVTIDIINDPEPELDETFEVTLTSGVGGSTIGSPSTAVVTIPSNDDISGVFSFTNTSLLFLIPESSDPSDQMGVATLTVQRTGNFVGVVTVYWEVEEDGRQDLEPTSGNLTFDQTTTELSFQVRAIGDGLPELFEAYTVRLVSIGGGGRIVDPREARIAIQSSNDPSGVVGFIDYPQGIIANEGTEIQVGVVRSSGSRGTVTVTWSITPPDSTVFLTTTDTVVFIDGQTDVTFAIQTLSDTVPEVARLFSLDIVSSSLASVNINASHIDLIITSSNSPHGVVDFAPGDLSVMEGDIGVGVSLVRSMGLVGDLRVNLTLQLDTADQTDFSISGQSVVILSGQSTASISLSITDDNQPEVSERFSLVISSVELLGDGGQDFDFAGDLDLIDQPPMIGSSATVTIVIQPSDDPFGAIYLTQSLYNAREGVTANISLTRTGGTFDTATVSYATTDRLATSPTDYISATGAVIFAPGMTTASIFISVVNDDQPELEEDFVITIFDATVASLGPVTMATVIISASDSPFGVVGFQEDTVLNGIRMVNPSLSDGPTFVNLTVVRAGGAVGTTDITWGVAGPGTGEIPRDDIAASTLSGTLILADGQSSGVIEVVVLPSNDDEVEESYVVTLQLASNNVFVDSDLSSVVITVGQMGTPFGVISFIGDVIGDQRVQRVNEENTPLILSLPVIRTGGNTLTVSVSYIVTRVGTGDSPGVDVIPVTGTVELPAGIGQANLDLTILPDDISELDESFQVTLIGSNAVGVTIDPSADTAGFIITANDSPFGLFSLSVKANPVTVDSSGSFIARTLSYTIHRDLGQIGDVAVTISNTYDMDPTAEYVSPSVTLTMLTGTTQLPVSLPITQDAYLYPGSEFTLSITNTTVTSPSQFVGLSGDISATSGRVVGVVSEEVANPLIAFHQLSLSATVDDSVSENNVLLTVVRTGSLGTVNVQWSAGGLTGSSLDPGSLTPPTGSVALTPNQNSAQFTLTATPTDPHGVAEVFSISLGAESLTPLFPARVDQTADTAIIEPWGVIELGGVAFTGVEGQMVTIPVWRRYGSMGSITVSGVASVSSDIPTNHVAATEVIDFPLTPHSVTMGDGQTIGYINISLPDNSLTSPLKVFTFQLTAVDRTTPTQSFSSPRLSSINLIGQVTIVDDEGGAGVFRVSPTAANTQEGNSLEFTVLRDGGTSGQVSVRVQTQEVGVATGLDYSAIDEVLVFADGDTERRMTVSILNDKIPEPEEGFRVQLSVPVGGVALVDPINGGLDVTIAASDNPGGVFSISTTSTLTLTEDTAPSAVVSVTRDPQSGLFGDVIINWEAVYTDTNNSVPISNILTSSGGSVTFLDGQITSATNIDLTLQQNSVPEGGVQFVLRISSPTVGVLLQTTEIDVIVQPRTVSVFRIRQEDITRVVTATGSFTMVIQRVNGLQLSATVTYTTSSVDRLEKTQPRVGQLTFDLAVPGIHFAKIENTREVFASGVSDRSVSLSVISVPSYPLAFFMDIGAQGQNVTSGEAVIVIMPAGSLSSLYSLYFDSLSVSTTQQLEMVSSQLLSILGQVSGSNINQSDTVRLIIDQLIALTMTGPNINYTTEYMNNMLDIFQFVLSDESFRGRSNFVTSMKTFAYSLVQEAACPAANTEHLVSYSRLSFNLQALKIQSSTLANRQFVSSSNVGGEREDYVQFPAQSLSTSQTCVTVHFLEILSDQIFGQPTLRSKVMSVGVSDRNLQPQSDDPVLLRLYSSQALGLIPDQNDCIQWLYPTSENGVGAWSSEFCYPITEYSNVLLQDSVMCACRQFGDLAVASDTTVGYSWTWPAGLSAAILAVVMVLVMILHLCYFSRTQLATRILVCLCFSVFLFQLMLLIDIFASRSPTLSDDGCVALGALLHFTIILQYVWILAMAVALWVNFMGFTDGREPLIIYVIISWGISIIIVVATILIGRFAVPLSNTELYSHTGGDLCYMPLLSASLLSTVLPVVVGMLTVVALLSHSCVYWSRWEDYHNMYHDSFNRTEIPLLLVFFALIFFTSLAGYLHVYVTVVYTYAAFVALNVIQALYALIVYFFVSWHTLTRKHKKFILGDEVEPLSLPEEPDYLGSMSSLSSSRQKMDPEEEWEEFEKDSEVSHPVVPLGVRRYPSDTSFTHPHSPEREDSHLDDLMFMLKTQTYQSDSETGSKGTPSYQKPKGAEHLELRRISIADTHL